MQSLISRLAQQVDIDQRQAASAVDLLDGGATVPFIARYRKEVTDGLDDTQLRLLEERLRYLRDLDTRRDSILASIQEQGKLDDILREKILIAETKATLEDLYLPYKPKRRTKAQIAREAGLEPMVDMILADPSLDPIVCASNFLNPEHKIETAEDALQGGRQILMERFTENADLVGALREKMWQQGELKSQLLEGKEQDAAKFSDYFDYSESIKTIPSHRALALFRGREAGYLAVDLDLPLNEGESHPAIGIIAVANGLTDQGRAADKWLIDCARWCWKVKLHTRIELDLKSKLREEAEKQAITVFGSNLRDLLLSAPAGTKATLGLDPGLRTGVKVAVVDATGKLVDIDTIYPHVPQKRWDQALASLAALVKKHQVELIAVGNGTASRETEKLANELCKKIPELAMTAAVVSEAGASVYSASELAAKEFPDLDVSIRGAVSIARRLQDPLAELVKIDPKSIGVGQYQHDVNQNELAHQLDAVVEDCVNAVGVDVNIASAELLTRVSGLSRTLAHNIVSYRDENGAFDNRAQLKKVERLGPKAFEQSAGFLRIRQGSNPLDATAVHPESYKLVKKMADTFSVDVSQLISNRDLISKSEESRFVDGQTGLLTVRDIMKELIKPGRDPRPEFRTAKFQEGVEELKDLREGMVLEGTVTNVTNFGAFVDIGVHQDGLVHISALSTQYVKDPRDVVRAGNIVKVRVESVDLRRKRVGLTMRLDVPQQESGQRSDGPKTKEVASRHQRTDARRATKHVEQAPLNAMEEALKKALRI